MISTIIKFIEVSIYILLGIILARFISNLLDRTFKKIDLDETLALEFDMGGRISSYLKYTVRILIYFTTLLLIFNRMNISTTVLEKVVIIFFVTVFILIILSFRNILPNISSGIKLRLYKKINKNDKIKIERITGEVIDIGFLETKILSNSEIIYIPNKLISKSIKG
ncbi:mechanosensitive ion channel [Candidatus Woesearchaeota archaeon]|nr:mechanosensitive ion channel [Candidatus Woesearchaeota archaeon]